MQKSILNIDIFVVRDIKSLDIVSRLFYIYKIKNLKTIMNIWKRFLKNIFDKNWKAGIMLQIKKRKRRFKLSERVKIFIIIIIINTIILFYSAYNIFEKYILHNVQGSKIKMKENNIIKGT